MERSLIHQWQEDGEGDEELTIGEIEQQQHQRRQA